MLHAAYLWTFLGVARDTDYISLASNTYTFPQNGDIGHELLDGDYIHKAPGVPNGLTSQQFHVMEGMTGPVPGT